MKRFIILGLPRSGTTYLMSLLDAHPDMICAGEQYNPYAVIGSIEDDSHAAVMGRDRDPVGHMRRFFEDAAAKGAISGGFKFMIGHNLNVLRTLAADPDVSIIYIWRENRLAQVSSLIKAHQSKKWAQSKTDAHVKRKINATPRQISHRWHEYATFDHLISIWLARLPNPKITYEYRELFQPGFEEGVCDFLGVTHRRGMKSRLVKQSHNSIADRFEDPQPIRHYFKQVGLARWLDDEL